MAFLALFGVDLVTFACNLLQQYRASRRSVGSGHYEFRLLIAEVKSDDFHQYKLTVVNEVDSVSALFTLVEGEISHVFFLVTDHRLILNVL